MNYEERRNADYRFLGLTFLILLLFFLLDVSFIVVNVVMIVFIISYMIWLKRTETKSLNEPNGY